MFRTVKKVITYVVLFFLSIYMLVWVLSPTVIRYFLSDYLEQQQLVLSDDSSIRYNPFLSHLNIQALSVSKRDKVDQAVFSLKSLEFELQLHQLLVDQVYISEFIIDGLYLNAKKQGERFEVAGLALPLSQSSSEPVSEEAQLDSPKNESEPLPYKLEIPKLALKNSVIELVVDESPHQLKLKEFVVTDFGATLASQTLLLSIDSEINQSALSLNVNADLKHGRGKVNVDLDVAEIELTRFKHFLPENITAFEGQVSYSGQHVIELGDNNTVISWPKLSLLAENLLVTEGDITIGLAKQMLDSSSFKVSVNSAQPNKVESSVTVEGTAQLELNEFKSFYQSEDQVLSAFKQLAIKDLALAWQDGLDSIDITSIELTDALFSDKLEDDIPALTELSLLGVNQVKLTEQGVSVKDINLSGLVVDVQLSQDKVLLNLIELSEPTETVAETTKTDSPDAKTPDSPSQVSDKPTTSFAVALGEFTFTDDAHIHFTDKGVSPAYERHFIITTLVAGPFDNQRPDDESLYKLIGKSDKYSSFDFSGVAKPFSETPFYHLKGFLKEVSLPGVSAYIKEALQYEIQSGQLDLGLDVTLTGDIIDGDADVLLRGIELTAADDHEVGTINDHTSVPFNMALGMLKDSDGNVELSLPLSGDTSSPSFGVSGFMTLIIQQATLSAAQDYLITTFVPYASVVKVAMVAGEFALKVRVNDLVYPAGEVTLQPEQDVFLQEFAALMKDKDDVSLKLCAVATAADIGKPAGTIMTDNSDIEQLKALSKQRVDHFKDYMVEKEGISSSRLLFCTPQINSGEDAKPSLTFSS